MDKYLELINEKNKELKIVKNEMQKVAKEIEISKSTVKRLENEMLELTRKIHRLEEIKELPSALKDKKIERFLSSLLSFATAMLIVITINTITADPTILTLEDIIFGGLGVGIASPIIYLFDTKDIRKKLKGHDLNNIDSKIEEKIQRKETLKKEYNLALNQTKLLQVELKEKRVIFGKITQKVKRIEALRAEAINIMLEGYLACQINEVMIPDELQKSDLHDRKVKQKLLPKDN